MPSKVESSNTNAIKPCSVVIPTKNGGVLFERVLEKLQQQNIWDSVELLIVDSGSIDSTVEVALRAGAKVIQIPPEEFNHGATRDYGISQAQGEIVVLMVQDAVPNTPYLLETILRRFVDPDVAGVYVRQIPQPDADLLTKRNLNNWLTGRPEPEIRKMKALDWYESMAPIEKYFFCNFDNVCSAVRKMVWQNHKFGQINFGEDIDWAERILKAGFKIVYEPTAAVIHSHDRPVSYEYKRTYVCHRKLYRQFGLHLVPSVGGALRSWVFSTGQDVKYVRHEDAPMSVKLRLWAKIPLLNFLSAVAQYRAARDEASGKVHHIHGV
jgi:rhamnosyltransferase